MFDFLSDLGDWASKGENLKGAGSIIGALADVYSMKEQKDHNEEMLKMEKERVRTNRQTDANRQAAYEAVWGSSSDSSQVSLGG